MRCFLFMCSSARLICSSDLLLWYIFCSFGKKRCLLFQLFFFFPFPSPIRHHRSSLLFTRISARLKHSLSLQTKINDMNTSSYSREPPSPKRATPQNASVGEKASHPSGNPQLARKTKLKSSLRLFLSAHSDLRLFFVPT